jgi:hypothetical protein
LSATHRADAAASNSAEDTSPTASSAPSVPGDGAAPENDAEAVDATIDAALPDADPSSDAGDGAMPPVMESYFPLADGYTWTYRHTSPTNGVWTEVTRVSATEFEGEAAWEVTASEDLDGFLEVQIWQDQGGTVGRVHLEQFLDGNLQESVDYDPGFARYSTDWHEPSYTKTISYTRIVTDDTGLVMTDTRDHVFTTLDVDATVTIDGTVYEHCLQVERHRADKMETKQFWFAPGIGKVKELDPDTQAVEELIDHEF